jgi:hypothetical protein
MSFSFARLSVNGCIQVLKNSIENVEEQVLIKAVNKL